MRLDAQRFLEDLSGRYAAPYTDAVQRMVVHKARGNTVRYQSARDDLAESMRQTMAMAELLGASLVLREAAAAMADQRIAMSAHHRDLLQFDAQPTQAIIPNVTFEEAAKRLVDATPVTLRDAAERTATRIGELYRKGNVVAFTKSAEQSVTERVQSLISEVFREGGGEVVAGNKITMAVDAIATRTEPWSRAYAKMAFRTNVNTATTAGRFRQVRDPDMGGMFPALEFMPVGDGDTRDNHLHAAGIYATSSRAWAKIAPPLGFSCRCTTRPVSRIELESMGRLNEDGSVRDDFLDPRAGPDPGFTHAGHPLSR